MLNECLNLIGDGAFLKEEKPKITRVEIISKFGRVFSDKCDKGKYYEISIQDDGRTIKLFEKKEQYEKN